YPEDGETSTILNFKRGIVSALAVPALQEDKNKNMPTIHGKCRTSYNINAREDIITDISLNRDLSRCDKFVPIRDHNSPLALITGMHYPLSQLVRSSQTCNYKFDNEKKHMTSGSCTETHILIPFSHKGKYGVTNVGKQELTLVQVSAHNDRVFDHNVQDLHMEAVKDKSAIQDKEAELTLMRELVSLPDNEGERRAHLFQKLVSMVRGLTTETLSAAVPDALGVSRFLTYQVLAQCGTPECSSAIMQILRTFETTSPEVDAAIFALGFMSNPSALLINDMLQMAKFKSSKPIMYALSNVVKRFYKAEKKLIPEIHSVAEFMADELGDCTGDQDHAFLTLRVIGNMAPAVFPASPALRNAVLQCVNQPAASQQVQQAAIQAYRQIPVPQEARKVLMEVLLNKGNPVQQRIAAYLVLMKDPETSELTQLDDAFLNEDNDQLLNFVMSHIINILSSTDPETRHVVAPYFDPMKLSSNYKLGSLESNMIYESGSYLPKEVMLDMTLKAFGFEIDMMEIGMEGKGFEPAMVALFGEEGFFPDTTLKAMYFVNENMPDAVSEMLQNIIPALKNRKKRENLIKEIGQNIEKLLREMKAAESPEAMVYLRLLGNELGYLKSSEIASSAQMIDPVTNFFAHYIFMDNEFFLPTVTGVPLRVSLSGTFAPGFKGGIEQNSVSFMPSAGLEFVTQVGSHIPEFVDSGLEMHTNLFHESGIKVEFPKVKAAVKLTIPAPTSPTKLLKVTNTLVAVVGSEVKTIPPLVTDKVDISKCSRALAGMKICTALQYTKAFSHETAPYFPFTGDSKFSVELHPTGDVTGYSATIAYEQLKEGEEGRQRVDSLKFVLRAEGMLKVQLLVPSLKVDASVKTKAKIEEELELELESDIKVMGATSKQKIELTYGKEIEAEVKMNSFSLFCRLQIITWKNMVQKCFLIYRTLDCLIFPRFPSLPSKIPMCLICVFNREAKATYTFNDERIKISVPVLFGGKSRDELKFPPALSTPRVSLPQFGLEIASRKISIPDFVVPEDLILSIPVFGKAEFSTKMESNLYDIEASMAVGKDVVEPPSYSAKFDVKGTSPIEILTVAVEGSGMVSSSDSIKAKLRSALAHKFIQASFNFEEDILIEEKISLNSVSKIEASSPLGLSITFMHTAMAGVNTEKITGEHMYEGAFKAGPIYGKVTSGQSFAVFPLEPKATCSSRLQIDSTVFKGKNTVAAKLAKGDVYVLFHTSALEDVFRQDAKLQFQNSMLSVTCETAATAIGLQIRNLVEAAVKEGKVTVSVNTNCDHFENKGSSLLTASFDKNGLVINSDANVKVFENEAIHKATLKMNKDGLITSGTSTLQSPLSLENVKLTYQVNYADLSANAKCSTTGKLFGTHMNHNTELEIVGLAATFNNEARFNSHPMRFDHTIRCSVVPFDFNLDAIFNADGDVDLYGKHSAQLFGKFYLRTQPLAFAASHESRASMTHQLDNGVSLLTTYDNKMDTNLSPQEQKSSFKIRSKMNEHAFNEDIDVYNTADRIGVEVSSTILTNIINTASDENQEFTLSGFLKYDKNSDSHIISFPLAETLPKILEDIKGLVVHVAETLQNFMNDKEVRAKLEALPQQISAWIEQMNIEGKITQLKDFIINLTQNFAISKEDVEASLRNLNFNVKKLLADLTFYIQRFTVMIKDILSKITFPSIPEKLVKSLEIPEIKLPAVPKEIMLPCFGKLYAEINLNTPVYIFKTTSEFKNATESKVTPVFTGLFSSEGTSQFSDILTYKFDSTTRISIPKRKRVVSLLPIRGKLQNTAFIAIERGMTATSDTEYSHNVQLPLVRSEFSATQKTVLRQDGNTVSLTSETTGKGQLNDQDGTHNSKVDLSLSPTFSSFSFSGDTNFNVFQAKQLLTSEFRPLHDFKFNVSNDIRARDMGIDYSTLEASGLASLREMKIELEAKHNTKSYGVDRVFISNGVIFRICPVEFFFNFQNKGNAGVNIVHPYTAKVDLQNDYLIDLNPDGQKLNAVFLARFNPYKISSSFRVENNRKEVGVFAEMKGEANLDFLTKPISIPEIDLPFIDFHSPATNDLNVYELTGLQSFLTTTDQAIDAEAKIVYQKSNAAPLTDILGLIPIPSLGNLITELSFKSAIINLNTNAGLFGEEDLVFRLSATTASVFEALTGKLEGTSSLTTKRGIKLANSLSLKNPHLNGNHDSTISVSTDTLETAVSVGTSAKIALPVLNFEVSHTLVANTQSKAETRSTLKIKGDFDIPLFKAIGKLTADHSLKIEETPEFVSVDSVIKSSVDGKVWENYIILGALDNDAHLYVNERKIRISSKLIADTKLNQDTAKIVNMDVNKNLALEASMDKIYAVLEYTGHNEANLFGIKTTGEHSVQSNIDFTLSSGLKANFEIDLRQPSDLSELTYFEKLSADVTSSSQKISFESKLDSLFYTSNVKTGLEGNFPAFAAAFKSSASTPIVLLDYDVDGKYIKVTYLL
uniref:Apolipoprotein Bb, tandem duplicate 2 n=1 Tax=Oryzias latipes TaxID=8090 RepID=A0A3P9J441_ORYLA